MLSWLGRLYQPGNGVCRVGRVGVSRSGHGVCRVGRVGVGLDMGCVEWAE